MILKITRLLLLVCLMLTPPTLLAQDITFSFANAQNTNDGMDDFYEVDVLIESTSDFKLGVGLLYFNYSTAAFGTNVEAGGNVEITRPDGYILAEDIIAFATDIYDSFLTVDNTTSRFAFSWNQAFTESQYAGNNVTGTAALLFHIKIKYDDVNESPGITFEDGSSFDDQTYTACGGAFTSDCTGSPGIQLTNDTFDSSGATLPATLTWDGSEGSDWTMGDNWGGGSPPGSTDNVVIANAGTAPVITSAVTVNNLTIEASASLTVNGGGNLTVDGDLTVDGSSTLTINSDATTNGSIIVNGSSTGNLTYNRYAAYSATSAEGWHLVSAPVVGESEDDIITNGSLLTNGSGFRSFASYDNSYSGGTGWDYINGAASASLDSGKGYSAKSTAASIPFTGTMKTDNLSSYAITVGSQNAWNLIGNPYPSFVAANSSADASNNFLTTNIAELDPSFAAIYMWNSSTLAYEVVNNATGARYIAPGQGFFVSAKAGGGTVDITEAMLSHQSGDLFLRNNTNIPEIKLQVTNGTSTVSTEIKYIEGTTTGLDVGYDAGLFNGTTNSFGVYSHLVSDSNGIDYTLQCLPPQNYEEMIIPIGLTASSGDQIEISSEALNLPSGLNIYIEDRVEGTFTRIDQDNTSYTIVLNSDISGIGRFYLHTNSQALSTEDVTLESVSIYLLDQNTIRIAGLQTDDKASFELYNILGKQLIEESFTTSTGVKDIPLRRSISEGVYIVKLATEKGKLNKKIMLNPR